MIEHISRFFIALLCLFFPVLGLSGCGSTAMTATTRTGFYFDTIINITVYDTDISHANETLDSCFDLAAEYENMLSRTVEGSDIWEINHAQGQPVAVQEETLELYRCRYAVTVAHPERDGMAGGRYLDSALRVQDGYHWAGHLGLFYLDGELKETKWYDAETLGDGAAADAGWLREWAKQELDATQLGD